MSASASGWGGGSYVLPPSVRFSWLTEALRLFAAGPGVWLAASVLVWALSALLNVIAVYSLGSAIPHRHAAPHHHSAFRAFLLGWDMLHGLCYLVTASFFASGGYGTALKQVRGQPIAFGDFLGAFRLGPMLAFRLIAGGLTFLGSVFCFLPGILCAGLLLPGAAAVSAGAGALEAFSASLAVMRRQWSRAFGLMLVVSLLLSSHAKETWYCAPTCARTSVTLWQSVSKSV